MAVFTIKELSPSLNAFNNTTVAGDTVVNLSGGVTRFCLGTEVTRGDRVVIEPDETTIIEVAPGETSVALVDGDYYRYDTDLNLTTVPATVVTST